MMSLDAETLDRLKRAMRTAIRSFNLTETQADLLTGFIFGLMLDQQARLQKRMYRALQQLRVEGEAGGLFRVFQFSSTAGRWEAAQRLKQLRRKVRALQTALDSRG